MPKSNAPKHLSTEARLWWDRLCNEYDLADNAAQLLLQTALEAHDRMKSCQAAINRDGESLSDRFGQVKPHPLLAAERDARSAMIQALKSLNLDIETTQPIGRPSGGHL